MIGSTRKYSRQIELDPVEMAERYGAETPVLDYRERLVCSHCGDRQADIVVRVKCARSPLLPPRIMSRETSERIYPEPPKKDR